MPKHVTSNAKAFARLESATKPFEAVGRTESAALLIWFLQTIYRFDDVEAEDAVCDQKHDLGVDALAVNEDRREIVLFQAKRKQKLPSTLGDTDLKHFVGALQQFESEATVNKIVSKTKNVELKRLLTENHVAAKIAQGYTLRPIFIANVAANSDADDYLSIAKDNGYQIDLWDLARLGPVLEQLEREWFVATPVRLKTASARYFSVGPKAAPTLLFAAIKAKELVTMPGISDTRIFAQNVRLGLGDTRVNGEIVDSVLSKKEHGDFLKYHNGLTIVAKQIKARGQTLSLNEFSVCNGCQSLLSFFRNRAKLTDDLEVLVRVVKVSDDRRVAERIAYRTNNQNAISLRDLNANDAGQIRIKAEFDSQFGHEATYAIKGGEDSTVPQLMNERAGQQLLALMTGKPWAAHQKYRVFGDLESEIFGYGITAAHVRLAQLLMGEVVNKISAVKSERIRRYALSRYLVLYLVGEILREGEDGRKLLSDPSPYLATITAKKKIQGKLLPKLAELAGIVATELNYFVEEQGGDNYDYKSQFKSPGSVATIRAQVLKGYAKDRSLGRLKEFALPK